MAIIKPKRTSTASNIPTTSNLEVGEIAINLADKKLYVRDTSNNIIELTTRTLEDLDDTTLSSLTDGVVLQYDSSSGKWIKTPFTFPTSDGSADQVLTTDGSGALSWADQTASSSSDSLGYTNSTTTAASLFDDGSEDLGDLSGTTQDAFGVYISGEVLDLMEPVRQVLSSDFEALT